MRHFFTSKNCILYAFLTRFTDETNPGTEMAIQAKIKEYQSRSTTLKSALQQPPAPQLSQPSLLPQSSGYGAGTPTPALMPSGSGYGQINPSMPPQRMVVSAIDQTLNPHLSDAELSRDMVALLLRYTTIQTQHSHMDLQ